MLTLLTMFWVVFPVQSQATRQQHPSAREIAKKSLPSVVLLVTKDENGNPVSLGSGFFVRTDVIATNHHVTRAASQILVKAVGSRTMHQVTEVLIVDEKIDLTLLKVEGMKGQPLSLSNGQNIAVGDEVYAIGNPEGLEGTFSQGIISSLRGNRYIQITAPISHGSSGGPVLNKSGKVVGVAVAILKDGQNLNFAIPISHLINLLNIPQSKTLTGNTSNVTTVETILTSKDKSNLSGEYFRYAMELYYDNRYAEAIEACKEAIKLEPESGCLGQLYVRLGRHQESLEAYKQIIRVNPDSLTAHFKLGDEYFELGRYKEAIEAHEQGLRVINKKFGDQSAVASFSFDGYLGIGLAHYRLGNHEEGEKFFRMAIQASPYYHQLGDAYAKLGYFHQAIEAYKKAIKAQPESFMYIRLGDAYRELNLYYKESNLDQAALDAYRQALHIDPNYALAHYNLGLTYLKLGNKGSALEHYKSLKNLATSGQKQKLIQALADELFDLIYK